MTQTRYQRVILDMESRKGQPTTGISSHSVTIRSSYSTNGERPHQALEYRTPAGVYYTRDVETTAGGMVESLPLNPVRTAENDLNLALILS